MLYLIRIRKDKPESYNGSPVEFQLQPERYGFRALSKKNLKVVFFCLEDVMFNPYPGRPI